jgi:hypothetical protein
MNFTLFLYKVFTTNISGHFALHINVKLTHEMVSPGTPVDSRTVWVQASL